MTENPRTTLHGTVEKIITSRLTKPGEKAQISVDGADELYKELRIENTLMDQGGNEVRLKSGACVDITIEAEPQVKSRQSNTKSALP